MRQRIFPIAVAAAWFLRLWVPASRRGVWKATVRRQPPAPIGKCLPTTLPGCRSTVPSWAFCLVLPHGPASVPTVVRCMHGREQRLQLR